MIPLIRQSNGKWARINKEKINLFSEYLKKVFEPQESSEYQEREILNYLETSLQMEMPIQKRRKSKKQYKSKGIQGARIRSDYRF